MNKLLRLALALFMSLNVLYADENDFKLYEVIEYKYNTNGELSYIYFYDGNGILRRSRSLYYDKRKLIRDIRNDENTNKESELYIYEYLYGKLVKRYKAEWTTHKPIRGVEAMMVEYEYNIYGNLVYKYERYNADPLIRIIGRIVPVVYKTKYEYENGIVWAETLFKDDVPQFKNKCVYDSEQKLVGVKTYKEDILRFEIKHHYDGNRLSYSTLANHPNFDAVKGKTEYEYDSSGKLIRRSKYGIAAPPQPCTPNDFIFR